jgi:hypothetical protein
MLVGDSLFKYMATCRWDSYITPVPDSRLASMAAYTLAADVTSNDTAFMPVMENTSGLPNPYGVLMADIGQDLQIGDEIVTYEHVNSTKLPFGLYGVQRGQYGTRAAAHLAGTPLKKLAAHRADASFQPSAAVAQRSLVTAIGERLAAIVDQHRMDMIYFDGLQSMGVLGPLHYTAPLVQRAFWASVKRDAIIQSSEVHPYTWHLNTRAGQSDWAATDSRAFMDYTKAASERAAHRMLFNRSDMGWWGYEVYNEAFYATTPDELEYMAARAVGFGANPNLETTIASLRTNGRTLEVGGSLIFFLVSDDFQIICY